MNNPGFVFVTVLGLAVVGTAVVAQSLPHPAFDQLTITGPGWSPTCPAANCAGSQGSPSVVAKSVTNGVTAQGAQAEWLSTMGLYNNTGTGLGLLNEAQKVTLYLGQVQGMNAGPGWTLNTDIARCAASPSGWDGTVGSSNPCSSTQHVDNGSATIGYELDFSNWDKTAGIGSGPFTVGMWINTLSTYTSTAGIAFNATAPQAVPSWEDGIYFAPLTAHGNTVLDGSGAGIGYHLNNIHATAAIYDESIGAVGLQISGTKSAQDIALSTASPIGLLVNGARSSSAIVDSTTGPTGITENGTHTVVDVLVNTLSPSGMLNLGTHSVQGIGEGSTSPAGLNLVGAYSLGAILDQGTTPVSLLVSGSSKTALKDSSTGANSINISGTHSGADIVITSASATALSVKAEQAVCFNGLNSCAHYSVTQHKWYFTNSAGVNVLSIDDSGNAIFKGAVTPSGTP